MVRFEPERDVPPGALSSSINAKSLNPEFCKRHAAVRPATPPPTITSGILDHASCGTSTRPPSRTRCPKTSDAPTISPAGSAATSERRHAAIATGTPRNPANSSRLFIATKKHKRHKKHKRVQPQKRTKTRKAILCFMCLLCFFVALFEFARLALVISHEHLVIEAVDLHGHGLDVFRECKHRGERLIVEKLQPGHRISWYLKRRRTRERESPEAETRHRRVIRTQNESRGFERANDAPVRVARKHRRC